MVDAEIQELVKPEGMPPLQWEWWKEWWAQDYSWNSERFKPYQVVIANSYNTSGSLVPLESTLKAQGHLIESPEGTLFHICWLPPYWRDGTESEFYRDPKSVRRRATTAFVTYFREHNGVYAGLTSTLSLMFAAVSKNIPLTRAERCFLGGPFIRENLVGNLPVELRHCLFAFEQAHGESHKLVDWNVLLSEATFSSVDSHQSQFSFNAVRFLMPVRLSDCEIDGTASFFHCVFDSSLLLGEISDLASTKTFSGGLIFYDCKFAGVVNVNKEGSYTQLTFDKCVFGSSFIAQKLRVNRVHSRKLSLAESIFEKKVQISAENLIEVAPAFEGATLKKGIDFGPFETVLDQKFFDQLYEEVLAALGLPENNDAAKQERHSAAKDQFDLELLRLIAGARVIRLASQSSGDKFSEAQLHALELAAYQRLSTTNAVSRRFACLYGLLSDYGCSLSKPIAWGGVLLLVSAFFYALLNEMSQSTSYLQHVDWPQVFHQLSRRDLLRVLESLRHVDFCEIGQALLYSLSRVIPVGPWQDLVFTDSILSTGKGVSISPSSWQKIVVVIVATLQSLFSAVFIFLFGLAARRKFQVG